jgi:hypothetical protein
MASNAREPREKRRRLTFENMPTEWPVASADPARTVLEMGVAAVLGLCIRRVSKCIRDTKWSENGRNWAQ